jgi:hypothetical protein
MSTIRPSVWIVEAFDCMSPEYDRRGPLQKTLGIKSPEEKEQKLKSWYVDQGRNETVRER